VPELASETDRLRLEAQRTRDTAPEMAIRRRLHALGYRYRVDVRPVRAIPRRADIVFPRLRLAVFVDGCFWHGCPDHMTWPRANGQWWRDKVSETRRRDEETTRRLKDAGWSVFRVWEHEHPDGAAARIATQVDWLRERLSPLSTLVQG